MSGLALARQFVAPTIVLVIAFVAAAAPDASASHYRFPAGGLVTEQEHLVLKEHQLETTLAFFEAAAEVKGRRALTKSTGISYARMTELATQCDLLRISGVGPSVVRLLQAAGIRHAAALRQARPDPLFAKLRAANRAHGIMEVLPDVVSLGDWIQQARGLPKVLEGVR